MGNFLVPPEKAGIVKKHTPILIGERKNYTKVLEKLASHLDSKLYTEFLNFIKAMIN